MQGDIGSVTIPFLTSLWTMFMGQFLDELHLTIFNARQEEEEDPYFHCFDSCYVIEEFNREMTV